MNLRDRGISGQEVDTLFWDVLSYDYANRIGKLLKLLGRYVFLNWELLNYFYQETYGEKVAFSTLKKSVKYRLIAEIQSETDGKTFYFQLKSGGYYFLKSNGYTYRRLPQDAGTDGHAKILAINYYLMEHGYLLDKQIKEPYEPLVTTDGVMLIHKKTPEDVAEMFQKIAEKKPGLRLEKMKLKSVILSGKSRGNAESMLDESTTAPEK